MDIKKLNLTFSPAHPLTRSPALPHPPTCSPAHLPPHRGFSLVEMLVTLSILAVIATMVGGIYINSQGQEAYENSIETMKEIKKAILGTTYYPRIRGVLISGYVADMGNLPPLNGHGQPESLWNRGDSPFEYHENERIWVGWHGPYIQGPEGGSLKDGWGRPLIFEIPQKGDLTVLSYGADGKPGGSGLDEDIEIIIKRYHYMAPVGGHVERFSGSLTIYYPKGGDLKSKEVSVDGDGNFMEKLIPIGLRSIDPPSGGKPIVFSVVSTMNWLGTLE